MKNTKLHSVNAGSVRRRGSTLVIVIALLGLTYAFQERARYCRYESPLKLFTVSRFSLRGSIFTGDWFQRAQDQVIFCSEMRPPHSIQARHTEYC